MPSGFTTEGFVPKTTAEIADQIRKDLNALYPGAALGPKTYMGAKADIVADIAGAIWDELQTAVASGDPDAAEDAALEVVASYRLVFREGPARSLVVLTLTGVPGTVVLDESRASIPDTTIIFELEDDATIVAVPAWLSGEVVLAGVRRHRLGNVYQCLQDGTCGLTGPSGSGTGIGDGTTLWDFLGQGTGAVDAQALAVDEGPIEAAARTLTEIGTATAGWQGVINVEDADPGSLVQSDESLRQTNEEAGVSSGDATPDGIRSNLLAVENVRAVTVFHNRTDAVDSDGVPPHSVEALVTGGDEQEIAETLFASVSAGDGFHGSISRTVVDSEGVSQEVRFSRPTEVPIWVTITVRRDPKRFDPVGGPAEVKTRVVAFGDALETGTDSDAIAIAGQVAPQVAGGVLRERVAGVTSVLGAAVGTAPSPVAFTVAISRRQFADYDSSRVVVVEVDPS